MYLNYKLKNGDDIKIYDYNYLLSLKENHSFPVKTAILITNLKNNTRDLRIMVEVKKDEDNKLYFEYNNEKIFVESYEYLEIDELIERINNKENISYDVFVASIIKNKNKISFIEKRAIPDFVVLDIRSYPVPGNYKHVECRPIENVYSDNNWSYKIETEPIDEEEKQLYGIESYYMLDLYSLVKTNSIKIVPRSNNLTDDKPLTKVLK